MNAFVITTSVRGASRTQVWNSRTPLPLGHPFQWILEHTENGIRVRDISSRPNQMISGGAQELSFDKIRQGAEIEILPLKLRIKAVSELSPVYENRQGTLLQAFACVGNWVIDSVTLDSAYAGRMHGKEAFTLTQDPSGFALKALTELSVGEQVLAPGKELKLSSHDLVPLTVRIGAHSWRFGLITQAALPPINSVEADAESIWFKKALRGSLIAFATFIALAWVWPKANPQTEDLVPAQFTKIVMSQQTKKEASAPSSAAQSVAANAPEKVQKAAVVQAFRAKALQNAVSGLLKGGMTQLLAQSDFVTGASASANARKIFDNRASSLQATGPATGKSIDTNMKVASLGGDGSGDGKTVGYGKSQHAGVNGQGHSFVSMDIAGSSVEEGLTKDEVGEVIHRHLSEVRYCYESAMLRTPDLEGKLMISFVIGGPGTVKTSEVKSSTLPDPRLDDCIIRRLNTWKFPNTKGGVDVAVTYPFIFKTLGR